MGNTRFNESNEPTEQDIIDSLYGIFEMTAGSSKTAENFEAIIKRKPSSISKKNHGFSLENELNNIIKCLEYAEKSKSSFDIDVKNIFNTLEKIIAKINSLDFEEETFSAFNTAINKLAICFSKVHSLEDRKEWQSIMLQHGRLIALIHNVVITRLIDLSRTLPERLEKNEKENIRINSRIVNLEEGSKKQTRAINQVISTIKSLPNKQKK